MGNRLNTDELRDLVCHFKKAAESLYRYGNAGSSKTLFNRLNDNDQKRLLYWALKEGDTDIKNVAKHFMQQLNPAPKDIEELLAQMDVDDRDEIEKISSQLESYHEIVGLSDENKQRITEILTEACDKIGSIETEDAFWVLIPSDHSKNIIWSQARGKAHHVSSYIRLPNQVNYEPEKEEKYELLNAMRESSMVLHIHNHPKSPDSAYFSEASKNDCGFAAYWKSLRSDLTSKIKFFIVQEDTAFEYSNNSKHSIQWLGKKIERNLLLDEEHDKKNLPFRVAENMHREERNNIIDEMFEG